MREKKIKYVQLITEMERKRRKGGEEKKQKERNDERKNREGE